MAAVSGGVGGGGGALRDCGHPLLDDALKQHNAVTFKLVKTGKCVKPQNTHNTLKQNFLAKSTTNQPTNQLHLSPATMSKFKSLSIKMVNNKFSKIMPQREKNISGDANENN